MLRRIASYLKGYEKYAVAAPLYVAVETVCQLLIPLLMAYIIDEGIEMADMSAVWKYGLLMMLVALIATFTGALSAKAAARAANGLGANLRRAQFEKVSMFSFADIDRFSSSSLITRMTNDVTQIQNVAMMCLRILIRALTMLIASVILTMAISARLALVVVVILPVMVVCLLILMKVCMPLFE